MNESHTTLTDEKNITQDAQNNSYSLNMGSDKQKSIENIKLSFNNVQDSRWNSMRDELLLNL